MRIHLIIGLLAFAARAFGDVSVTASVDQARIGFGDSVGFTIRVNGAQNAPQLSVPRIDGLNFAGPSLNSNFSIVNGSMSQSLSLVYQITPTRPGEFIIPALDVNVGGKIYKTDPIKLTVDKPGAPTEQSQSLFARVQLASQSIYLGQTAPLNVIIFARANLPMHGLSSFSAEAGSLNYKYDGANIKSGTQTINGEAFNVYIIEGAISPTHTGALTFGPCIIKAQVATNRRNRGDIFEMLGRVEVREVPVTIEAVPIEVLPLPAEGRPADFAGAIGQWKLELEAKPTEVAVGDPITVTVKISGTGNIDTVPPIQLTGLENFKTYEPTSKTTKNDLNTIGERVLQQVVIAKDINTTQLPAVRLAYFEPVAKEYRTVTGGPIALQIKAGGKSTVVGGGERVRKAEELGEDIVYLKSEPGALPASAPPVWPLNLVPVVGLAGALLWKRRQDRLAGNVALARRSRAARNARKVLAEGDGFEAIQRALQEYLGDRLNIPASGITASVVDERKLPGAIREIFEACDAARFAGAPADVPALKQKVEQVIDELES